MSGAFDYALNRLSDEEVADLQAGDEQRARERVADGLAPRCRPGCRRCTYSVCVAGKCQEAGRWRATYRYVTGRKGRVSEARRLLCDRHAEQFRAKHLPDGQPPAAGHASSPAATEDPWEAF